MAKQMLLVDTIVVSKNGMRQAVAAIAEKRPLDETLSNFGIVQLVLDTLGIGYVDPYR